MRIIFYFFIAAFPLISYSQNIAINTNGNAANASALLDVSNSLSTNLGVLLPQVALTATNAAAPVSSPATGLIVYNTASTTNAPYNVYPGYYYWDGFKWVVLLNSQSIANTTAPYFSTGSNTYVPASASGVPGTGTTSTWTVPAGVYQAQVFMIAGGGGSGYDGSSMQVDGSNGGIVIGTIDIVPTEVITIFAGAGGTGYGSGGANSGKGGTGCYITAVRNSVATLLCQAGGGGGGSSNASSNGVGGGVSLSNAAYPSNGGNANSSSGGSGGNSYTGWLRNCIAFKGNDCPCNVRGNGGMFSSSFTAAYNAGVEYGTGGYFGNGSKGVVIIKW